MARHRKSVREYIDSSKSLLQSNGFSEDERETLLNYLEAIEKLVTAYEEHVADIEDL